ncbi:hypothetical protein BD410DRAFT_794108 [Rickenella mellea]|uniref:Uncharacterized protein n=1 Tax=Rickenella mellea TaxID=50990 RepID=A0A4Y7PRJ5_9AGAM|nr:hypothetical protein BD410DRAFT_794108 [Rickenella mellea]
MTDRGYVMFPRPSIHQSPLVLGRVCRLWREYPWRLGPRTVTVKATRKYTVLR